MANIYITGDKHRDYHQIQNFCRRMHTTKDDLLIVLGDNGVNYYGDNKGDRTIKRQLQKLPITFMMIRGNHDMRPTPEMGYQEKYIKTPDYCGYFMVQEEFPDLLFACDGHMYALHNKISVVIGGAYSVDKEYRLQRGLHWFSDEQLTPAEMRAMMERLIYLSTWDSGCDVLLTHTCPARYRPVDMFLPGLDQAKVDDSMERWLDTVEQSIPYKQWYCGHWHTDRTVDKIRFMYHDIVLFE